MKMTSIGTVSSNRGIKVGTMSAMSTSTASDFIIQATEGIIKHLEKVDAEPEEDDFMKEDETTDFTLFEVICHQSLLNQPGLLQLLYFRFLKMTQIQH